MSDDITPALTPHRWAVYQRLCEDIGGAPSTEMLGDHVESEHELAALALHGQPFGFTRADVDMLLDAAELASRTPEERSAMLALAARIEAILPPA